MSRQTIHNHLETRKHFGLEGLIHSYAPRESKGLRKQRELHSEERAGGNKAKLLAEMRKANRREAPRQMRLNFSFGDSARQSELVGGAHLSFPGLGSGVADETATLFVTTSSARSSSTSKVRSITAAPPGGSGPDRSHTTVAPATQLHPPSTGTNPLHVSSGSRFIQRALAFSSGGSRKAN